MAANFTNAPLEFQKKRRWIVWKWTDGKKEPYKVTRLYSKRLKLDGHASSTNPKTWTDFATAVEAVEQGLADGIGYALEEGYIFVDLDKCVKDGRIESDAQSVIDRLASYTEISQSETGAHIVLKGQKPTARCRRGHTEIYDHSRFMYLTGDIVGDKTTIEERDVGWLCEETFGAEPDSEVKPVAVDLAEVELPQEKLDRLLEDENFRKTWNHNRPEFHSMSEYDLSLADYAKGAGWTDAETAALLKAFRMKHGNAKDKKKAERKDYVARTIAKAKAGISVHRTETGNARMLVSEHGDKLKYDHIRKRWFRWGEHYWKSDNDGHVSRLAQEVAKVRYKRAVAIEDLDERKKEAGWAITSESRKVIDASISLAGRMKPVADDGTNWDRDIMLLGCENGVLELRTGELRQGKPEDRITKSTGVIFDSVAKCPLWEEFLSYVTKDNDWLKEYLQCAVGYSLTGIISELDFFFIFGPSFTGKSTFVTTIGNVMGDYGGKIPIKVLMSRERSYGGPNESLANLEGVRFGYASETEEGKRIAVATLKEMTSGEPLTADRKHEHERTFMPQHKLWLTSNHEPAVSDDSMGFWNRVKVIEFEHEIPEDMIRLYSNKGGYAEVLKKELPGILNWAIEGCLKWQRDGLREPEMVKEAVEQYKQRQDTIARFIEDQCIVSPDEEVRAGVLFGRYEKWARGEGLGKYEIHSSRTFGDKISKLYKKVRTSRGKMYVGIGVNTIVEMHDGKLHVDLSEIEE